MVSALVSTSVFADTDLMNDVSLPNGCIISNIGVYSDTSNLEPTWSINTYICQPGYYLPADGEGCVKCPNDYYCVGGAWTYNTQTAQGIEQCPNGWYAPAGMSESGSCGRILHVGDNIVYLRSTKKTTPSLNIKIGDNVFYGNMTLSDVGMHEDNSHKLKIGYDNQTFSVYDDSVVLPSE